MENIVKLTSNVDLNFKGEFNLNTLLKRRKYMSLTLLMEDEAGVERQDFKGQVKDLNGVVIKYYPIIVKETDSEIVVKYPEKNDHIFIYFEYRRPKTKNMKITRIGAIQAILR